MDSMFPGCKKLSTLGLGSKFRVLDGPNIGLPEVPSNSSYLGKWQNVGAGTMADPMGNHVLTSIELVKQYNGTSMADTYVWRPKKGQMLTVQNSTLTVGDKWTAKDNFVSGKDKTGKALSFSDMKVSGTVNTSKAGTYKVTYTYDGLSAVATIIVKSKPVTPPSQPNVNYSVVYRLYNKNTGEHFYTTSAFERSSLIKGG